MNTTLTIIVGVVGCALLIKTVILPVINFIIDSIRDDLKKKSWIMVSAMIMMVFTLIGFGVCLNSAYKALFPTQSSIIAEAKSFR